MYGNEPLVYDGVIEMNTSVMIGMNVGAVMGMKIGVGMMGLNRDGMMDVLQKMIGGLQKLKEKANSSNMKKRGV